MVKTRTLLSFFLMLVVLIQTQPVFSAQVNCDRQCLITLAEDYIQALVAHDPSMVPLSPHLQTVENLKPIILGEGLWNNAAEIPDQFKIFVPDPVSQQIGFIVVMKENNPEHHDEKLIQVAFRLQLKDGEIIEAEHLINHEVDASNANNLTAPRLPLVSTVASPYQDSRERLLSIGAAYYDALVHNNGALAPFADDCVRHENGFQSSRNQIPQNPTEDFAVFASMGCSAQLNTQIYSYIDSIDFRRVEIADKETGLVFALSHFRQAMGKPFYRTIGVPGHEALIDERDSYDLSAVHIFKIWAGQIHEVEAVGYFAEYMTTTGWE